MDLRLPKSIIGLIRQEQERRASLLREQDPDFAYDQWLFVDGPFIAELCLMALLALRHQLERELLHMAARATGNDAGLSPQEYLKAIESLERHSDRIAERLKLQSLADWKEIEILRLLVNCYKHDSSKGAGDRLLALLNLKRDKSYAELPESDAVRKGLAVFIRLDSEADYCDIVEKFIDIVSRFLEDVRKQNALARVNWPPVSLVDFAR